MLDGDGTTLLGGPLGVKDFGRAGDLGMTLPIHSQSKWSPYSSPEKVRLKRFVKGLSVGKKTKIPGHN